SRSYTGRSSGVVGLGLGILDRRQPGACDISKYEGCQAYIAPRVRDCVHRGFGRRKEWGMRDGVMVRDVRYVWDLQDVDVGYARVVSSPNKTIRPSVLDRYSEFVLPLVLVL